MKNLLAAINAVMQEVGYVQKGSTNQFHHYNYASEGDLLVALRPAIVKHGILLLPSLDGEVAMDQHGNTNLVMAYTLAHVSGEVWPEKLRFPGCGNDKNSKGGIGDKGCYKALTGANKYLLFKLHQIATGDDPENEVAETPSVPDQDPIVINTRDKPRAKPRTAPETKETSWVIPVPMKGKTPDWEGWVQEMEDVIVQSQQESDIDNLVLFNRANLEVLRAKIDPELYERLRTAAGVRRGQLVQP